MRYKLVNGIKVKSLAKKITSCLTLIEKRLFPEKRISKNSDNLECQINSDKRNLFLLKLYSQDQEFVKRFSTRASAESTESTVMGGLAKKVASKLSSTEMKMKAIVQMTDRIKRLEASLGHAVEVGV